jgi:hypothetical protein
MTKQELNQKLREINERKIADGTGFLMQGTNKVGKDLLPILQDGEEVVDFFDARMSSLFKFFKGTRYARCYLVITTKRLIYIERGNYVMGVNPLAKKTITLERKGIRGEVVENSGIEKIEYPYLLRLASAGEQYEISIAHDVSIYLQEKQNAENTAENEKTVNGIQLEKTTKTANEAGLEETVKAQDESVMYTTVGNPNKHNSKLPLIIGGAAAAVAVIAVVLLVIPDKNDTNMNLGNNTPVQSEEQNQSDVQDQDAAQNQSDVQDQDAAQAQNDDKNVKEQQKPEEIEIAQYVDGNVDDLLQVCDMLSTDDSETYSDASEDIMVKADNGVINAFLLETEKYPMDFAGVTVGSDFIDISDEELAKYGYTYYGDDADVIIYLYKDQMAGVMFENDESGIITGIYWMKNMMDALNDTEKDTESSTDAVQYAQGEVENFAGEYQGSDATLYISLGTEVSISEQQEGDTVGTISISTAMGTIEAELWKQDVNEYAIYQETGNAVIGRMTVLENAVIVTDSSGFDGTYELVTRYES